MFRFRNRKAVLLHHYKHKLTMPVVLNKIKGDLLTREKFVEKALVTRFNTNRYKLIRNMTLMKIASRLSRSYI